jgi:hypothetical protein
LDDLCITSAFPRERRHRGISRLCQCCSPSLTLTERRDGAREGCSRPALSQPDVFVRAHLRETQEMVFDDNDRAFTHHVRTASRGSFGRNIRAIVLENHEQAFCRM